MALSLSDMRTSVQALTGNRVTSSYNTAWYTARVNSGYRRLVTFQGPVAAPGARQPNMRRLGFFELEDRSSRTLTSALTSNFVEPALPNVVTVLDVYDATYNVPLDPMNERDQRALDPDALGRPRRWFPAGQGGVVGYYIDRRPGSAADNITVYEYSQIYPAALVGDADTPVIPDDWHQAIVYAAAKEAAELFDMPEKAGEMENRFISYIAERKSPKELAGFRGRAGVRRHTPIGR